ncbi:L-rhamnose mutarotase [Nocardia sp. CA-128927]|uniref:L-rhamnose mutarotase n=1 Tax=Nocardia sp. CA-128927 TaxID=3239975 RepID=UPI003D96F150
MRIALHTKLKPGAEAEYEEAHRAVPAELVAAIKEAGATSWTIWRSGTDLFHVIDCAAYDVLLSRLAELPVNVSWQLRINEYLEASHDYSAVDAALPVVWELNSSGGAGE